GLGNLQWVSDNEVNGLLFTIERSDDGVSFKPLMTLSGIAGEGRGASYLFNDPNPVGAQTFYRIKMSRADGQRYSNLVLLGSGKIQFAVRSAVNPFIDHITVDLTTPADGKLALALTDMYGRVVRRLEQQVSQGLNNVNMYGLSGLPAGTYALQIQLNDQLISRKLVKAVK
ncbi:MAG TPA: T9SS type A sorting domain-containing protein, partial [Puia sp.]